MTKFATALLLALGVLVMAPATAYACDDSFTGSLGQTGGNFGGTQECVEEEEEVLDPELDGPYVPTGPPPPVYEDYWTPACSANGPPPGGADAMCMGAATICDTRTDDPTAIFMQHWRRQVPGGTWESAGNECRGADEPANEEPEVTQEMVLDEAYAAAPRPNAQVQPGTRSYVNVPNNYYADAADDTVTVNLLGHQIPVRFTVTRVSWDFGDAASGTGKGVKDADVGSAGAVEHAYTQQGSYTITATSQVGISFTLPGGPAVDLPTAFSMEGEAVELPVGEIQTRVDNTN